MHIFFISYLAVFGVRFGDDCVVVDVVVVDAVVVDAAVPVVVQVHALAPRKLSRPVQRKCFMNPR